MTMSMPGGDINFQYMPVGLPTLKFTPTMTSGGVTQVATPNVVNVSYAPPPPPPPFPPARVPPKIRLNLGRLFTKQTVPFRIPAALIPVVNTRIGTIAGLPQGMPQIGFEQREGLWIVSDGAVPVLTGILNTMVYQADQGASPSTETGQAAFIIGTAGNALNVVGSKVSGGQAALIDKSSIMTGVPKLLFTSDPSVVAAKAGGDNATHALINGSEPKSVLDGALKIIHGGAVPSSVVTSGTPWLTYGLIGAGVLGVGYLVFRKK